MVNMIQEGKVVAALLTIHQDALKIGNLLHKQDFVDSQFDTNVIYVMVILGEMLKQHFQAWKHFKVGITEVGLKVVKGKELTIVGRTDTVNQIIHHFVHQISKTKFEEKGERAR